MKLRYLLVLLVVCVCCVQSAYGESDRSEQKRLVHSVYQEFPQLRNERSLCVLVTSIQRCVGCGVLAVNGTLELLRQIDTTIPCVVVLVAEKQSQAQALQSKFLTPFFLVDTASALLSPACVQSFPWVWMFGGGDSLLFQQKNLQSTGLDYIAAKNAFSSGTSSVRIPQADEMFDIPQGTSDGLAQPASRYTESNTVHSSALEEPVGYSIGRLSSPVFVRSTQTLFAINTLNSTIGAWDAQTGKFKYPIALPDTLVYHFCKDTNDPRWLDMKKQGHDIASLRSIAMDHDTLIALLDVLSGYTMEKKLGRTPVGTIDTIVEIKWSKRQLVISLYNRNIVRTFEVPTNYFMIQMCALREGGFGGTCVWSKFRIDSSVAGQRDSIQFLRVHSRHSVVAAYTPTIEKVKNILLSSKDSILSIGTIAANSDGALWYCDPRRQALLVLRQKGVVQSVKPQGVLCASRGGIVLASKKNRLQAAPDSLYAVSGLIAREKELVILLTRDHPTPDLPPIVQIYSTAGKLLTEQAIAGPLVNSAESIQLIAIEQNEAVLLVKIKSVWSIVRTALTASLVHDRK